MTTIERLTRGLRIAWPANVVDGEWSYGACDGTTLAVVMDTVVIARDVFGMRIGTCSLADAIADIRRDWPVTVTAMERWGE